MYAKKVKRNVVRKITKCLYSKYEVDKENSFGSGSGINTQVPTNQQINYVYMEREVLRKHVE